MPEKKTTPIKKTSQVKMKKSPLPPHKFVPVNPPCHHSNLVPLEVSFIRITHPNGYKEQPKCEFYVGISLATAFRVRKYFCPDCKEIIKAPSIYAEEK